MDVKDISSVKAALVLVLEKAGGESVLSRVHFHCLTYHIILERKGGSLHYSGVLKIFLSTCETYLLFTIEQWAQQFLMDKL